MGIRPVSAKATKNRANVAIIVGTLIDCCAKIKVRLVVFADKAIAKTDNIATGSTKLAINISLDEPMPPKVVAGSSPAKAKKKRAREKRKITAIRSPTRLKEISSSADSVAAKTIYGVSLKSQEHELETTSSLEKYLLKLKYG